MPENTLELFSQPTRDWFLKAFGSPTDVQKAAWPAIAAGKDVLVSAPTGTGKTLSAFLIFIDKLHALAREGALKQELYLIYISPLKSLAGDIRENLRRPLDGIWEVEERGKTAEESGRYALERDEATVERDKATVERDEATVERNKATVERDKATTLGAQPEITVAIRTGDTSQKDRQRMIKHPPHILITTPESLYLMLTSRGGRSILQTAKAIIIDELHALIDTKRGAHLMLSVARLDALCGRSLQRIGLSATIEPLPLAAEYLSPQPALIAAPPMTKKVRIEVVGTLPSEGRRKDPVWEELAKVVYRQCLMCRSVIAFSEGRRYAEKLAYYVNLLGGEGFARVHHGSLAREQRDEVEAALRDGSLRLLCATSSMELGIDVGDIDQVLQIGCPRTVSGTMQRLGRAGHNPNRTSVMFMYPRTAPESVYCGMTAETARHGGVEEAKPPVLCLDILAQHLVSMAACSDYTISDVMEILKRAWPFKAVTEQDVESVLKMLSGDYEHDREIPARPRVLYDRIHGRVTGDPYSRMLAVAAGGTIPDKGMYTAKTEDGVKLGELDEEFVYESRIGDKFVLGSFAWKILRMDRDTVIVTQAPAEGARLPFWKGEIKGRALKTSLEFGKIMGSLEDAARTGNLTEELSRLGLDEAAADTAAGYLKRQMEVTEGLPSDRTILVEHFKDRTGCHQIMFHALFGRRVNTPLSLLVQKAATEKTGANIGCVDDEDGFLLYPYGNTILPDGLLAMVDPDQVRQYLEAVLPETPLFNMTFRYNASRALMMGMKRNGRQPLWMQRLKSTELLDSLMADRTHPLIRETSRECLEDLWDIEGVVQILQAIRSGQITVREVWSDTLSPMSLPFQWAAEAAEMYEYYPSTPGIRQAVYDELKEMDKIKPAPEELSKLHERKRLPENETQLHSLLMMEGDLAAGELDVPIEWLETLASQGLALYLEPGLWIAAEHKETYEKALNETWYETDTPLPTAIELPHSDEETENSCREARASIIRRMLYYRGGQTAEDIGERYFLPDREVRAVLEELLQKHAVVEDDGVFYHAKLYDRARKAHLRNLRLRAVTQPPEHYAALMADRTQLSGPPAEQLKRTVEQYCSRRFPVRFWENVLFAGRVTNYSENLLDKLLAEGDYFWKMSPDGTLCFCRYDEIDWNAPLPDVEGLLEGDEKLVYSELKRRGASFLKFLTDVPRESSAQEVLLKLAEKGLVCADSFIPVRQWQNREKVKKATARQRVSARVMALSAGRWDIVRPLKKKTREEWIDLFFRENPILCRETFRKAVSECGGCHSDARDSDHSHHNSRNFGNRNSGNHSSDDCAPFTWTEALEILRIREYTGQVRRGYFISGMSGAQFIRKEEYDGITTALQSPQDSVIWLNATDPALVWAKLIPLPQPSSFLSVPGTAVALHSGKIAAIIERQGKILHLTEPDAASILMTEFVKTYKKRKLFPDLKRLILKEYPENAPEALKQAGFIKEMNDYVLYR